MTYKELRKQFNNLSDGQLDMDVTIYDAEVDEFYGCYSPKLDINTVYSTLDNSIPI